MLVEKIYCKLRLLFLKKRGLKIGGNSSIRYFLDIPRLLSKVKIGEGVSLDRNVTFVLTETDDNQDLEYLVEVGSNVYCNKNTNIDATTKIVIGDDVMIGPNCYITDHDHDYKGSRPNIKIGALPLDGAATTIQSNVWLGAGVVVLKGVTIGQNSIIGAGSIVTKDIPVNSIAVGSPCKVIKKRYDNN